MDDFTQLVHRAQSGSPEAFSLLVNRFQNMAYGYAYAILGDFDLAQDAAQEAFVEAYQVLPALREPLAFPAWLKRIVYKHCDRLTRPKSHRTISLESIVDLVSPQPGPYDVLERSEVRNQVQEAMRSIPANLRAVMILFYVDEYSYQEIALFLGMPVKTVKSRLHASRVRLKERMLSMLQDEFDHNRLPETFTQETVEQSIKHAAELNKDRHFDEAETLLRSLLTRAPGHLAALKELNRAVMRGRVYGQGRWDLLAELADQGKTILKSSDDEDLHRQVAQTLLAIPRMPEGIAFLENWIIEKGPNLERLGMLAWAKTCSGDFPAGISLWNDLLRMAHSLPAEQVLLQMPFIAYTLVNALSAAGTAGRASSPLNAAGTANKLSSAQSIARQVWETCGLLGPLPAQEHFVDDSDWLVLWRMAKLDASEISSTLLARHPQCTDLADQAVHLAIRGWIDPPGVVISSWLEWVRTCIAAGQMSLIEKYRLPGMRGLRARDFWQEANRLAWEIWRLLGSVETVEAQQVRSRWDWERYNPVGFIEARNWQEALDLVRAEIIERGVQGAVGWAAIIAGGSGAATPPVILQALEENGVDKVDEYGMFGWYIIAREAARAGEQAKAFDALRKSLSYWANPPFWISDLWEQDSYWGSLREHPEFKQAFDERRRRIGTVYGELHYFPGW